MKIRDSIRVFFINVTCGYGSTGRIVTGLYEMLEDQDITCMAAYRQPQIVTIHNIEKRNCMLYFHFKNRHLYFSSKPFSFWSILRKKNSVICRFYFIIMKPN